MEQKTARELLEESLTMIAMPLVVVGDDTITGWIQEDEFGAGGTTLCNDSNTKYDIIDPQAVEVSKGSMYTSLGVKGVCSIGAIALADLTNEGLKYNGQWKGWHVQVGINPQVALATVALVKKILETKRETDNWLSSIGYTIQGFLSSDNPEEVLCPEELQAIAGNAKAVQSFTQRALKLAKGPLSDLIKATEEEPVMVQIIAWGTAGVVTGWNDHEDRTYLEVADMFQATIKSLIEAEGEVK